MKESYQRIIQSMPPSEIGGNDTVPSSEYPKKLLTLREVSRLLSETPQLVKKWAKSGKIPGVVILPNNSLRFRIDILEDWMKSGGTSKEYDREIDFSKLTTRTRGVLRRQNIMTINQLKAIPPHVRCRWRGCGSLTYNEISRICDGEVKMHFDDAMRV